LAVVGCGVVIVWALGFVLIAVVRGWYLSTSRRWGFKEEAFFLFGDPRTKGKPSEPREPVVLTGS